MLKSVFSTNPKTLISEFHVGWLINVVMQVLVIANRLATVSAINIVFRQFLYLTLLYSNFSILFSISMHPKAFHVMRRLRSLIHVKGQ